MRLTRLCFAGAFGERATSAGGRIELCKLLG